MNLKPLQDWAVIRRSEAEERTAGGIIIPDTAKEKPLEGIIVAIGPGVYKLEKGKEKEKKKKFVPTILKPGQKVIYQKYAEREVEIGSEVITLVREEDILGTVEDYVVSERKTHALAEKKEGSVAIREKAHVPAVTQVMASVKKPAAEKKAPAVKPAAKKTTPKTLAPKKEKPAEKKMGSSKKAVTKKPAKKAVTKPAKTAAKKGAKKSAPAKKKVKPSVKKSAPAKKAVKKAVAKKTAVKKIVPKKAPKKAGAKKTAVKKIAVKKVAKKVGKKGKKK